MAGAEPIIFSTQIGNKTKKIEFKDADGNGSYEGVTLENASLFTSAEIERYLSSEELKGKVEANKSLAQIEVKEVNGEKQAEIADKTYSLDSLAKAVAPETVKTTTAVPTTTTTTTSSDMNSLFEVFTRPSKNLQALQGVGDSFVALLTASQFLEGFSGFAFRSVALASGLSWLSSICSSNTNTNASATNTNTNNTTTNETVTTRPVTIKFIETKTPETPKTPEAPKTPEKPKTPGTGTGGGAGAGTGAGTGTEKALSVLETYRKENGTSAVTTVPGTKTGTTGKGTDTTPGAGTGTTTADSSTDSLKKAEKAKESLRTVLTTLDGFLTPYETRTKAGEVDPRYGFETLRGVINEKRAVLEKDIEDLTSLGVEIPQDLKEKLASINTRLANVPSNEEAKAINAAATKADQGRKIKEKIIPAQQPISEFLSGQYKVADTKSYDSKKAQEKEEKVKSMITILNSFLDNYDKASDDSMGMKLNNSQEIMSRAGDFKKELKDVAKYESSYSQSLIEQLNKLDQRFAKITGATTYQQYTKIEKCTTMPTQANISKSTTSSIEASAKESQIISLLEKIGKNKPTEEQSSKLLTFLQELDKLEDHSKRSKELQAALKKYENS